MMRSRLPVRTEGNICNSNSEEFLNIFSLEKLVIISLWSMIIINILFDFIQHMNVAEASGTSFHKSVAPSSV